MTHNPGIDPEALVRLERIGGPVFVKRMIDLFLMEAPQRLAAAREGEKSGNIAALAEAAHSLKSSAHNYGASRLSFIAEEIELSARANKVENLSTLLNDLEQAYSTVKSWLESQRSTLPP
jgi:HPt (histidine-containing phosphotransfer) domain-containing protein